MWNQISIICFYWQIILIGFIYFVDIYQVQSYEWVG